MKRPNLQVVTTIAERGAIRCAAPPNLTCAQGGVNKPGFFRVAYDSGLNLSVYGLAVGRLVGLDPLRA